MVTLSKAYLGALATLAVLALVSLGLNWTALPFWLYTVLVGVLALFIFAFLNPLRVMKRQALLSYTVESSSAVRTRLWDGTVSRLLLLCGSIFIAFYLSFQLSLYKTYHWILAFAFALVYPLFLHLSARFIKGHVNEQWHGVALIRLSAWLSFACFLLVLVGLEYYWLSFPDTRHLTLSELFHYEFSRVAGQDPNLRMGITAWLYALEASSWHLMQHGNWGWPLFLVLNALKFVVLQWVILGGYFIFRYGMGRFSPNNSRRFYTQLISMLALITIVLSGLMQWTHWSSVQQAWVQLAQRTELIDPCSEQVQAQQKQSIQQAQQQRLAARQRALERDIESEVDILVERVFENSEQAVERFLEWNFSIVGQYQQLGYFFASSVTEARFIDHLGERANIELMREIEPLLQSEHDRLETLWLARLTAEHRAHEDFVSRLFSRSACLQPVQLDSNILQHIELEWSGIGVGAATLVGHRLALFAGRVTGRHGVRRVTAALFTRLGLRAGAISSGSLGAVCGPLAVVCSTGIVAGSWLAIDYGLVAFDEAQHREELRAEMLAALDEVKADVRVTLTQYYVAQFERYFETLEIMEQERFRISDFRS